MLNIARWRIPRITLAATVVLVVALLVGRYWFAPASLAARPVAPMAIPVETAIATRTDVPVILEGLGTIQAHSTVTMTSRVDGQLQKVAFTEGATVKKGALLAQIDPRPYQAALSEALATKAKDVAQLASAQADLERYEILAPRNLASKQQLDSQRALVAQLQAQIQGDQASIDNARTQLSYTAIRAPISGVTGIRNVDPGNIVHTTDAAGIVVVTQMQPSNCIFTLPEKFVPALTGALQSGAVGVTALSEDGSTALDQGTLALVDNQIDQATGTVRLKATFPNARGKLWPGAFVRVRVLVSTLHGALTVPTAAIQRGPNGLFTYVVNASSTAKVRPLQVGQEDGALTVVTRGLQEGERVVTGNQYILRPGALVRASSRSASGTAVAAQLAQEKPQ